MHTAQQAYGRMATRVQSGGNKCQMATVLRQFDATCSSSVSFLPEWWCMHLPSCSLGPRGHRRFDRRHQCLTESTRKMCGSGWHRQTGSCCSIQGCHAWFKRSSDGEEVEMWRSERATGGVPLLEERSGSGRWKGFLCGLA